MFCAQCGSNIKDTANFCKYCGAKVKKSTSSTAPSIAQSQKIPEPKQTTPAVQPPRFITKEELEKEQSLFSQPVMTEEQVSDASTLKTQGPDITASDSVLNQAQEKFDPITDDIIDSLYSREREVDIKDEIKENLTEVEKIEQRLNIGLLSKEDASNQITEKQNLMTALKAERQSLKLDKIRIETLEGEIKELQDKLDKLEIMKAEGKIAHEAVYDKLKTEYESGLEDKSSEFNQQKRNITQWLRVLELDVQKMKEDIDMTNAKADLGEVPKEDAEKKQSELEIDIYRKELAYHALKKVQEAIKLET